MGADLCSTLGAWRCARLEVNWSTEWVHFALLNTDVETFLNQLSFLHITLIRRYWHNRKDTYAKLAFIITESIHKLLVPWQNIGGDITYRVPKQIIRGHVPLSLRFQRLCLLASYMWVDRDRWNDRQMTLMTPWVTTLRTVVLATSSLPATAGMTHHLITWLWRNTMISAWRSCVAARTLTVRQKLPTSANPLDFGPHLWRRHTTMSHRPWLCSFTVRWVWVNAVSVHQHLSNHAHFCRYVIFWWCQRI